jgi:hypothetical protein
MWPPATYGVELIGAWLSVERSIEELRRCFLLPRRRREYGVATMLSRDGLKGRRTSGWLSDGTDLMVDGLERPTLEAELFLRIVTAFLRLVVDLDFLAVFCSVGLWGEECWEQGGWQPA